MAQGSEFQRAVAVFHAVVGRDPASRAGLLDEACAGDAALRAEVESLLAADAGAAARDFLDVPAAIAAGLAPAEEPPLREGTRVGTYVIEREIGRGGMATVYRAEDQQLGRKAAVKVLKPEFTRDPRLRERLRREARAAAALAHPGIATVYSLEEVDGQLCLVGEYVSGATLRAEIERGAAAPETVIDTGIQIAQALAAAHAAGVVHRDLKPENLIRDATGRVRILDFGIAHVGGFGAGQAGQHLTEATLRMGTPGYMSPEQVEGAEVDGRCDIFALGVVLYELASGRQPFKAGDVLTSPPASLRDANAGIPVALEQIILRCLGKARADRYGSALEVAGALDALRSNRPSLAPMAPDRTVRSDQFASLPPRPWTRPLRWWVFHQVIVMAVAALMVWPVALVYGATSSDWTLALLIAVIATAGVNGTLRAHLLFLAALNTRELRAQLAWSVPWLRRSDWLFGALLLLSVAPTARSHVIRSAVLASVAVGWFAASLVIEPATRRAAFPDTDASS